MSQADNGDNPHPFPDVSQKFKLLARNSPNVRLSGSLLPSIPIPCRPTSPLPGVISIMLKVEGRGFFPKLGGLVHLGFCANNSIRFDTKHNGALQLSPPDRHGKDYGR